MRVVTAVAKSFNVPTISGQPPRVSVVAGQSVATAVFTTSVGTRPPSSQSAEYTAVSTTQTISPRGTNVVPIQSQVR